MHGVLGQQGVEPLRLQLHVLPRPVDVAVQVQLVLPDLRQPGLVVVLLQPRRALTKRVVVSAKTRQRTSETA